MASDSHNHLPISDEYLDAVAKLTSGEDLAWRAEAPIVAQALNEALNAVRAERDRLREAVLWISNVLATEAEYKRVAREALDAGGSDG